MLITINCPSCGREIKNVESDWAGQKTTCGLCGNTVTVPDQADIDCGIELDRSQEVPDGSNLPFFGEPLKISKPVPPEGPDRKTIPADQHPAGQPAKNPFTSSFAVWICAICLLVLAVPVVWKVIDEVSGNAEWREQRERRLKSLIDSQERETESNLEKWRSK